MKDKGILIPVDFTQVSENAVSYAIGLAQKLKSKLVFVHAYSVAYPSGTPIGMATMAHNVTDTTASQEKINKEKLDKFLRGFPELDKLKFQAMVGFGATVDVISGLAKEMNTSLVVMGTKGASSGFDEIFIGTVTEKVTQKAPCPVLAVPEDASYTPYRRIGVAVDTDSMDNRIDFEILSRLLENYNAQLHFVHIADEQERVLEKAFIRERFGKLLVPRQWFFTVIQEDKTEEGIDEFLTETPIDLLVLLYREHGFFEALFKKGLRKKMLYASKAPLLIVK